MKITAAAIRRYPTVFAFMLIITIMGTVSYVRRASPRRTSRFPS